MNATAPKPEAAGASAEPPQRILKIRRDCNTWGANETIEDYALRFTRRSSRKWSVFRVSNTASGYIGSTISSFVYASFTFILFALEAAIMAWALDPYSAEVQASGGARLPCPRKCLWLLACVRLHASEDGAAGLAGGGADG